MLDGVDITFYHALERRILRELQGDRDYTGLYQSIRASPNWDTFQRTNGMISAYENVVNEMRKIARQLNNDPEERNEPVMRPIN